MRVIAGVRENSLFDFGDADGVVGAVSSADAHWRFRSDVLARALRTSADVNSPRPTCSGERHDRHPGAP